MTRAMFRGMLTPVTGGCGFVLPTPFDDQFDCGTVLDTTGARFPGANAWTKFRIPFNALNYISADHVAGQLEIHTTSNGNFFEPCGAYQTLPAGDCTFQSSFTMPVNANQFEEGIGIFVSDGTNHLYLTLGDNFGHKASVKRRGTSSADYGTVSGLTSFTAWGEISRVGSALTFRYSQDAGGSWTTLYSASQTTDFTTAPTRVGVFGANQVSGGDHFAYFDWFKKIP